MPIKDILSHLDNRQREALGEVIRFAVVGILAVFIQATAYLLLVEWLNPTVANTIAYLVSFCFNYVASTRFTFRVKSTTRRGAGFVLSHMVNYLLQTGLLNLFLLLGMSKRWAMIPMFVVSVPVNFVLVRYFLKKK